MTHGGIAEPIVGISSLRLLGARARRALYQLNGQYFTEMFLFYFLPRILWFSLIALMSARCDQVGVKFDCLVSCLLAPFQTMFWPS